MVLRVSCCFKGFLLVLNGFKGVQGFQGFKGFKASKAV